MSQTLECSTEEVCLMGHARLRQKQETIFSFIEKVKGFTCKNNVTMVTDIFCR